MIEHTEQCEKRTTERRAWQAEWPNHCKRCRGAGAYRYPATFWEPEESGLCPECVEEGKCPRCADPLTYKNEKISHFGMYWEEFAYCDCGWNNRSWEYGFSMPDDACDCADRYLPEPFPRMVEVVE